MTRRPAAAVPVPVHVRIATSGDGAALAAIYRPAVVDATTSFELEPPDAAEMAARVAKTLVRTPWLVAEREGSVIGYAYAGPHRERAAYQWSVEVSAYVAAGAQRLGVGRVLYERLFAVLALQGFRTALAGVTLPNPSSLAFHAATGFREVGTFRRVGFKFGAWRDVTWLERELGEYEPAPRSPIAFNALMDGAAVAHALSTGRRIDG